MRGYGFNRDGWPEGEWDSEPDRAEWRHRGFPCLAKRNTSFGAWCGYVAVPPGHRLHGVAFQDALDSIGDPLPAHGGLTYSAACSLDICHTPRPGEPSDVWWLGFDCQHHNDYAPGMPALLADSLRLIPGFGYRPLPYVRACCNRLAEALAHG